MQFKEKVTPKGVCTVTHVCKTKNGLELPLSVAMSDETKDLFREKGWKVPEKEVVKNNLVVNTGRAFLAKALGGSWENGSPSQVTPYVNRITMGTGTKSGNLPNLSDTGLVQELQKLSGTVAGTFLLEGPNEISPDIVFPPAVERFPIGGGFSGVGTITINVAGETLLTDVTVDFINTIGVQLTDQVTIDNDPTNPLVLGVREVRSATVLVLHNPTGYTGASLAYAIATPGTQMLVSKLIEGNDFAQADYGVAVLIHEAGLLLNNGTLFNRVVYYPDDEGIGLLLQSDETNGVEISLRIEWLITM